MVTWISDLYSGLGPIMQAVLTASWQASVLAVMVLGVQAAFGRWLSARWRYALWSVVVVRLLMPVTPGSTLSVFNLFRGDPEAVVVTELPTVSVAGSVEAFDLSGFEPVAYAAGVRAVEPVSPWSTADIMLATWLAGAALVLGALLLINGLLAMRLRRGTALNDPGVLELVETCKQEMGFRRAVRVYEDAKIASPALAGMFRPTLLLPAGLIDELPHNELRFILMHELAHAKRHDIAMNWLLIVLSALHWFNPLIWFTFSRLRADRELVRDAMVLRATGTDASQAYGQTIIRVLERLTRPRLSNPALAGVGDGMGQLKRRMRMIALSPKRRPALTAVGVVLLAALAAIGLTDAAEPESEEQTAVVSEEDVSGPVNGEHKYISLSFDEITLEQAIDQVREKIDVPLFVDWEALKATGVDREKVVHMAIGAQSARLALLSLLKSTSQGKGLDAPVVKMIDEALHISTRRALYELSETRVYDVQELIATFNIRSAEADPRREASSSVGVGLDQIAYRTMLGQISDLIRESVGFRDDWEANGGDYASVRELNGKLIIKTSPDGHGHVIELLAALRKGITHQIIYQGRILMAPERFCEAVGLNRSVVHMPDGVGVSFLDDLEVEQIVKAARDDRSVVTLAVPMILQSDGKDASVTIAQQTAYVDGYERVENESGVKYEPIEKVVAEGVALKVMGKISDDVRSVTVTLEPIITTVALNQVRWADSPSGRDLLIDKLVISKAENKATVTVPDTGTVLIDAGQVSGPMGMGVTGKEDPVGEDVQRRVFVLVKLRIILQAAHSGAVESSAGVGRVGE